MEHTNGRKKHLPKKRVEMMKQHLLEVIYVGIDWADGHHDILITDDSAKRLERFRIAHTCEGFAMLYSHVANHQMPPSLVLVAIETSRGLLVHELLQNGYVVYAINPKAVNRNKDRHVLSKANQTPSTHCRSGISCVQTAHLFQPFKPLSEDYRLRTGLRKVVDEKSRVANQATSCLKEFYPKALDIFSPDSQIFIDFLKAFPDHRALITCTKKVLLTFLKKHRHACPAKADELWKTIQSPTLQPDKVTARSGRLRLGMLLDQLESLKEHINLYEQEIQDILDKLPESDSVKSLPGVGDRLAPELVATLGPNSKDGHHRFQAAEEITKLSGCLQYYMSPSPFRRFA